MKDSPKASNPGPEEDGIARLLRLLPQEPTVHNTAIPKAVVERARAAATTEWQQLLLRRRRRRMSVGAALAATVLFAFGLLRWQSIPLSEFTATNPTSNPTAWVEKIHGPVEGFTLLLAGQVQPSLLGDHLEQGTTLTTGESTRVALRLGGGESLRLDVGSQVELLAHDELRLLRGGIYIDSETLHAADGGLLIHTPLGTATNLGTQFEVRLVESTLRVRVREGRVKIQGAASSHEAAPGAELTIDPTGAVERQSIPVHGPAWRWSLDAAPSFHLEGSTLADYLAWVERETGWQVRFASPHLATSTTSTVLHGTLQGIPPDQTPDLVLPTCGLHYQLAEGILTLFIQQDSP